MFDTIRAEAARLKSATLSELAGARAGQKPFAVGSWSADVSRHWLDESAEATLQELAATAGLETAIQRLFAADHVNASEDRPALHWAQRLAAPSSHPLAEEVRAAAIASDVFGGEISETRLADTLGKPVETLLHIGIGGSDFGPRLLVDALRPIERTAPQVRFVANIDPEDLAFELAGLDPSTTFVVGVSKSFGTEETLYNLDRVRDWLRAALGADWTKHAALVTANPDRARNWADGADVKILHMPESVGGRFSIWSAGSVACAGELGEDTLSRFRRGAYEMDEHMRTAPVAENLAAQLALLDVWNTVAMGFPARAVLAYSRRLRLLPAYLQQLEMESNGKSVTPDGTEVTQPTAALLWGGEGTIGQHSYHQWLHQGTEIVPCEFILAPAAEDAEGGNMALTAHALAQAEVLANGRDLETVRTEEPGLSDAIARQKVHAGGRPSTFFHTPHLTPEALGALIALYEHRTYLAGVLYGVNSFDQWGVERGKTMAGRLKAALAGEGTADDPVTASLIAGLSHSS
jgi:glucose-6-phosphate isomerase